MELGQSWPLFWGVDNGPEAKPQFSETQRVSPGHYFLTWLDDLWFNIVFQGGFGNL